MRESLLHSGTTKKIIDSFYEVYNRLGYGFLEKVYDTNGICSFQLDDDGLVHKEVGIVLTDQVTLEVDLDRMLLQNLLPEAQFQGHSMSM